MSTFNNNYTNQKKKTANTSHCALHYTVIQKLWYCKNKIWILTCMWFYHNFETAVNHNFWTTIIEYTM